MLGCRLDASHSLPEGALDAAGAATSTVDVPDNPALIGLAVYWQGLIGEPLRASTLEVTTLTAL